MDRNNFFKVLQIIDLQSINQFKTLNNLIYYFNPQIAEFKAQGLDISYFNKQFIILKNENAKEIRAWGKKFLKSCPSNLQEAFIYISKYGASFSQANVRPYMVLIYSWKLFFDKFPNGKIFLINHPSDYYNILWDELDKFRISEGIDFDNDEDFDKLYPQEYTGCMSTEFPYFALNLMTNGIPTRILGYSDFQIGVVLYYVPDITITYSQILDSTYKNHHVIDSFTHIFSDNLSQNMPVQDNIFIKKNFPKPNVQMNYFKWFFGILNSRVIDILKIQDPLKREQSIMTINRAMCEGQLCIIHRLPYLSKILFFNCLDKLANFNITIENGVTEDLAFKRFFEVDFLNDVVLEKLKDIPDEIGDFFRALLQSIINIIEDEHLTPEYMKAMRNSIHGYNLRKNNLKQLMERSADINNYIVNLVIPLLFYYLLLDWNIN